MSILAILIVFITLIFKDNFLYEKYRYPYEEFYGKDLYSEITYDCPEDESEIGNIMVGRAFEIANYTGTEQNAETEMGDVGALSRYYYFDSKDAITQEADFNLITCKINDNEGHVWVETTILRQDKNGENAGGGCREALSLWYIEYQNNQWNVVWASDGP